MKAWQGNIYKMIESSKYGNTIKGKEVGTWIGLHL